MARSLDATCEFGWCGYPRKKVLHIKEIAGMLTFKGGNDFFRRTDRRTTRRASRQSQNASSTA